MVFLKVTGLGATTVKHVKLFKTRTLLVNTWHCLAPLGGNPHIFCTSSPLPHARNALAAPRGTCPQRAPVLLVLRRGDLDGVADALATLLEPNEAKEAENRGRSGTSFGKKLRNIMKQSEKKSKKHHETSKML